MSHLKISVGAALLATLASTAGAQFQINRVVPNAANEGDLIIIQGINLQNTTMVDFFADTGGIAGPIHFKETPISVSATEVTVLVTKSFGFVGPPGGPVGNPNGSLSLDSSNGRQSNSQKFFYMEATWTSRGTPNQTTTLGTGTTQSGGQGKSVVSFDIAQGPPQPGNANFIMELENATPGPATLMVGVPGTSPFFMFGDGEFVLDLFNPIVSVPGAVVDANGDASLPFPIPAGPFGVTLCNQWAQLDLGLPGGIAVSNGLVYTI